MMRRPRSLAVKVALQRLWLTAHLLGFSLFSRLSPFSRYRPQNNRVDVHHWSFTCYDLQLESGEKGKEVRVPRKIFYPLFEGVGSTGGLLGG